MISLVNQEDEVEGFHEIMVEILEHSNVIHSVIEINLDLINQDQHSVTEVTVDMIHVIQIHMDLEMDNHHMQKQIHMHNLIRTNHLVKVMESI